MYEGPTDLCINTMVCALHLDPGADSHSARYVFFTYAQKSIGRTLYFSNTDAESKAPMM